MFKTAIILLTTISVPFYSWADESLIIVPSQHSVSQTADRFVDIVQKKGFNIFARVNHRENAEKVGMTLRPTEVIIFGNPKVGTKLMQCDQNVAIDLPQKALIYEDEQGTAWIAYNNPIYLKKRHDIKGCDPIINKVGVVLNNLASQAAQ